MQCTVKIFEHAFVVCFPREPRELFQSDLMINYNYFWYVQYFKVSVYFLCIVCHFGCLELLNVWLRSCIKCIFLNKFLMPSWWFSSCFSTIDRQALGILNFFFLLKIFNFCEQNCNSGIWLKYGRLCENESSIFFSEIRFYWLFWLFHGRFTSWMVFNNAHE